MKMFALPIRLRLVGGQAGGTAHAASVGQPDRTTQERKTLLGLTVYRSCPCHQFSEQRSHRQTSALGERGQCRMRRHRKPQRSAGLRATCRGFAPPKSRQHGLAPLCSQMLLEPGVGLHCEVTLAQR